MKFSELQSVPVAELHQRLAESRGKLVKARFGTANRQLKNMREVRQLRRSIAQLLTALHSREK